MEQAAKDIYNEFKDQLRKMNIEYRTRNGLGALFIDLNKSTNFELDISYYKVEDIKAEIIKMMEKTYKNSIYFVFTLQENTYVIEEELVNN
jgi:hypothetical protein